MSSDDMESYQLVVFMCCESGANGGYRHNFPAATVDSGAKCAIGFEDQIYTDISTTWVELLFQRLAAGNSVLQAAQYATAHRQGTAQDGLASYVIEGNPYTTIQ
jgi:hypothetical protein